MTPSDTVKTTETINSKPVYTIPSKAILNTKSAFKEKLLCDGPTFSLGSACVYSCSFCYVPGMFDESKYLEKIKEDGYKFEDVVIRRQNALNKLKQQLTGINPSLKESKIVCYTSPIVDAAATVELCKETAEACNLIFSMTNWDVRILTKSNLLPFVAKYIEPEFKLRVIYGCSTGTLNDELALAFEEGTAKPSKRIQSIRKLQDMGLRTFGMLCPNLPIPNGDYAKFALDAYTALGADKLEDVWGEVINVRGESMTRTISALKNASFVTEANLLHDISTDEVKWEQYARDTFKGLSTSIPSSKLHFLQYVTKESHDYWKSLEPQGAVLLGSYVASQM